MYTGMEGAKLWNWFSRPWKSIEFGQNVHKVLKRYGNSKIQPFVIQNLLFTTDDSFANLVCIVFHE